MSSRFRLPVGLFLTAMVTLAIEIMLTRVFDVILWKNVGYLIITCALFAFGLSGVWSAIRPLRPGTDVERRLAVLATLLAVAVVLLRPAMNAIPFDYGLLGEQGVRQLTLFALLYLVLLVPFFLSGLIFVILFSAYASRIRRLYCWDLCGAAVGCVLVIPFIRPIGPGGLLLVAAAGALLAGALFAGRRAWWLPASVAAVVLVALPVFRDGYFDFVEHVDKRGVRAARSESLVELTEWDPISKIDVIAATDRDPETGEERPGPTHVAYDGGTQSSHLHPFDGDLEGLRAEVLAGRLTAGPQFWHRGVLLSHFLRRDTDAEVLVIGSAAGQEIKAALVFGAGRVDGIELVETVVRLTHEEYAGFIGNIMHDPRVTNRVGEGRSFVRASDRRYDIIQIHSNHSSSSVAQGTGAADTTYLQTAEAYGECFRHLADEGMLHVNHRLYPRMITTAALAWRRLGRDDFQRHVLVFEREGMMDTLPTMVIKMRPWTAAEVDAAVAFMRDDGPTQRLVIDPIHPERSFLSAPFFSGRLPDEIAAQMDYHIRACVDDRPYFKFLARGYGAVEPRPERFLTTSDAAAMNARMRLGGLPMAYVPFLLTGLAGLFFSGLFIVIPLLLSRAGRVSWPCKYVSLGYFSCLGAGFIMLQLVFVQIFMKLIGYPLHAYAVVLFTMLLAAGLGSLAAQGIGVEPARRWTVPFIGIIVAGAALLVGHAAVFEVFLAAPTPVRIGVSAALIFPVSFFMGMPFPLGILSIRGQPEGAIAWAWGMNGLFTVIGSSASVAVSILLGFRLTLLLGLAIYALAFVLAARLRHAAG